MKRGQQTVVAVCTSSEEALEVVNRLAQEGYSREDITVYANKGTTDDFSNMNDVRVEKDNDQGVWDKVKGVFRSEDEEAANVLDPYRGDIRSGKYVLIVENYQGEIGYMPERRAEEPASPNETGSDDTVHLKEEQLDVNKQEVTTGDVDVTKEVTQEVRTVEVPVEKEEVVVEKRSLKDGEDSETIRIPTKEEQIEVTKKPVNKEEVSIHKERTKEMKQVSGDIKKEKLDVDTRGDARVDEKE